MGACIIKGSLPDLQSNMAEANKPVESCKCAPNSSQASSTCQFCQAASTAAPQNSEAACEATPSTSSGTKRTFRSLGISCKKSAKSKEKGEKSAKSKLSWTLRWRLKSPQAAAPNQPLIDLARFNPADYPIEDRDEAARRARAREIAEGIEMEIESLPACYRLQADGTPEETVPRPSADANQTQPSTSEPNPPTAPSTSAETSLEVSGQANLSPSIIEGLTVLLHRSLAISMDSQRPWNVLTHGDLHFLVQHFHWHQHQHGPQGMFTLTPRSGIPVNSSPLELEVDANGTEFLRQAHTQVDYLHCLVPDLLDITKCSFYWGKMDRYEAERLLEGRPDGTFLLRDSAQEEYLFSVSFRRYNRSLHARIEQWNHRFSFDSHDPGVYSSPTILGLIDHYKNPELCMFFEPTLTRPLHRNSTFTLQHLCRAVICSNTTYDGVNALNLPKSLKLYLKEYHYKQRIRVRRLDG